MISGNSTSVPVSLSSENFNILRGTLQSFFVSSHAGLIKSRNIVFVDNVPDNRNEPHLLFLNPYEGRPSDASKYLEGVLVHPMPTIHPSKVRLR